MRPDLPADPYLSQTYPEPRCVVMRYAVALS